MTTNLFIIANVKQLRILLPFFRKSLGVGILNSTIFNSFHNRVEFGMILEGLRNFGGVEPSTPYPLVRPCFSVAKTKVLRVLQMPKLMRTFCILNLTCILNALCKYTW